MATMDDLIATISGGMHVSQDGYDIKALQEYLTQTIILPTLPSTMSPSTSYRPMPPSRAPSLTRKASSYPSSHTELPTFAQPLPSPMAHTFSAEDMVSSAHSVQRPASLRQSSSYAYTQPGSPYKGYSSFESDAFAPLVQQRTSDPWARMRAQENPNPWAQWEQPGPSTWAEHSTIGARYQSPIRDFRGMGIGMGMGIGRPPAPPDEDDEMMDEDEASEGMDDEVDDEESVERMMGIGPDERSGLVARQEWKGGQSAQGLGQQGEDWERGRRKI